MVFFLVIYLLQDVTSQLINFLMAEAPSKEIMDVLVANEPASRNFIQNFTYQHHTISHEHRIQVEFTAQKGQSLQINNQFATVKDNQVLKITQIYLENRIIKIIDSFSTTLTPWLNRKQQIRTVKEIEELKEMGGLKEMEGLKENGRNVNRKQILNKKYLGSLHSESQGEGRLRDTKNLVKNTIRLFQTWLEERLQGGQVGVGVGGGVYQRLMQVIGKGKFNNNLVIDISKDPVLRKAFLFFCSRGGQELVSRSKIHDKSSHLQAIRKYQNLCRQEEELSQEGRGVQLQGQGSPVDIKIENILKAD